ncbi:hypothetical protein [Actinophytocola sp.]|uniref:hypothetical protein n=1 Tax=Actinophytocola sp. TaxID=1872138 RepID=UPI0025BB2C17|nr:hypothetical protein [Actinophytocola sp.]
MQDRVAALSRMRWKTSWSRAGIATSAPCGISVSPVTASITQGLTSTSDPT